MHPDHRTDCVDLVGVSDQQTELANDHLVENGGFEAIRTGRLTAVFRQAGPGDTLDNDDEYKLFRHRTVCSIMRQNDFVPFRFNRRVSKDSIGEILYTYQTHLEHTIKTLGRAGTFIIKAFPTKHLSAEMIEAKGAGRLRALSTLASGKRNVVEALEHFKDELQIVPGFVKGQVQKNGLTDAAVMEFLLQFSAASEFDQLLNKHKNDMPRNYSMQVTGPWPPYTDLEQVLGDSYQEKAA